MNTLFSNTAVAFDRLNNQQLKRANYLFSFMSSQFLCRLGINMARLSMWAHMPVKWLLRNTIFQQFCGGETLEEAALLAENIGRYGVSTILDYGVEGKEQEKIFDATVNEFANAIKAAAAHKEIPFISLKVTGFARFELLQKVSDSGQPGTIEIEEWSRVFSRINQICKTAAVNNVMVLIDAEENMDIECM